MHATCYAHVKVDLLIVTVLGVTRSCPVCNFLPPHLRAIPSACSDSLGVRHQVSHTQKSEFYFRAQKARQLKRRCIGTVRSNPIVNRSICLFHIYIHKISVKTQQLHSIPTTSGLHVSTPSSHHQALRGTNSRTSKLLCTLGSQALTKVV
jgi:hypothetical protein